MKHRIPLSFLIVMGTMPALTNAERNPPDKIAWFGTLEMGLEQAANANRPILLISGAPHCHGVPGTW